MSGPDTFFASDSIVDLFTEPDTPSHKTYVEIEGTRCLFISYTNKNRTIKVSTNQSHNPFEWFGPSKMNVSIMFPKGNNVELEYTNPSFKIDQSSNTWIVTIGDKDE